jgi:hypothetical protein
MKKNIILIVLVVVIASLAIIVGICAFRKMESKSLSPEETVSNFYNDWINYNGNPLIEKIYQENDNLTDSFKDKLDVIIDSNNNSNYDPILCNQNLPAVIKILDSNIKDDTAIIFAKNIFLENNKIIELSLIKNNGWKINNIVCQDDGSNVEVSPTIKNLVIDYLENNISDISPKKEVLGGKFMLSSIIFINSNNCLIEYEDGHITLTARVKFNISQDSEVEIETFEIIEDDNKPEFIEIGNITKDNNQWYLVYEKPGKPALRVELLFDDDSRCDDQRADNSCLPAYWRVGDRVEIKGVLENEKVRVKIFKIIGEASKNIDGGQLGEINSFSDCVDAGYEILYPDCINCLPYCETDDGRRFENF